MASISSAGIGSGLDVDSIVTQLVAAERTPTETRLTNRQSELTVKLSALGRFNSVLSNVQSKLDSLLSSGALGALTATSSASDIFTATASEDATIGTYDVEVVSLAKASKQVSDVFAGGADTALGAGDVQIGVGSESFTVTLESGSDSLADLRDAINNAADNTGVTATLINESGGTRLLLTAKETGTDNTVSVSSSLINFSEKQAAADAHLRVEGYDVYSASNTVTDAIEGVTIDLLAADEGTTSTLTVGADLEAANDAIEAFVTAYNSAMTTIKSMLSYDAETESAGSLNGDSTARGALLQMRNIVGSIVSDGGAYSHLSEIGITTETDGTLTIDEDALSEALSTNRSSVTRLFSGEDGIATRLDASLEGLVSEDGVIASREESINSQLDDIEDDFDALDRRMAAVEARYLSQFTALDTLLAQLSTTSDYLTQQLESIAALRNSINGS